MIKPYQLIVNEEEGSAELYILGDIVENAWFENETSPTGMLDAINKAPGENLTVHINSYGGSTSAGITIYNTLKNCGKKVTTIAEGFACSAASLIFCAGEKRIMRKSSLLMIHNAWCCAQGNAEEMRKVAEDLEKISSVAAAIYSDNSTLEKEKIDELLNAETWITPEEALEYGFATCIEDDEKNESPAYSSAFGCIAKAVMRRDNEQTEMMVELQTAREIIREMKELAESMKMLEAQDEQERMVEPETGKPEENVKTAFQRLFEKFN